MTVQIHTDNNVSGNQDFTNRISEQVSQALQRFSSRLNSVQVHLGDENGKTPGTDDKRCTIEARLEGMDPLVATCHADTHQAAVKGAIQKVKGAMESAVEKQRNY